MKLTSIQSINNNSKCFMQDSMAWLQFRSSSFLEVFEKHFEDCLLEENRFKGENRTLIDAKTWKLRRFYGETTLQASMVV